MVCDAIIRRLNIMPRLLVTKHHLYDPIPIQSRRDLTLSTIYDQHLVELELYIEYEDLLKGTVIDRF
jgi:hypothetical protein